MNPFDFKFLDCMTYCKVLLFQILFVTVLRHAIELLLQESANK